MFDKYYFKRLCIISVSIFFILATATLSIAGAISQPVKGDDGIYRHSWMTETFLDLQEDYQSAKANGKRLVVFVEQKGCIYCRKIQTEILVIPKINAYVRKHFEVVQVDMWGAKEITDFDGEVTTEKKLVRKWGLLFTPTIVFFPENIDSMQGKNGKEIALAMMPGAFGEYTFIAMFEWIQKKYIKTVNIFRNTSLENHKKTNLKTDRV
jgi:thioredoxin-related protein